MRRTHLAAVAVLLAAVPAVAADSTPAAMADCTPEDGATYVVEGEISEQTITSANFTYPEGDVMTAYPDGDPTGGELREASQVRLPYVVNFPEGHKGSVSLTIEWDTPGDIDLDVYDANGDIVAEDHSFNPIETNDEAGTWGATACETYTVVINNSYALPSQDVRVTAEVTSKSPRR